MTLQYTDWNGIMGTLKVDNLQKRDGTALITDGVAQSGLLTPAALRSSNAVSYTHPTLPTNREV